MAIQKNAKNIRAKNYLEGGAVQRIGQSSDRKLCPKGK